MSCSYCFRFKNKKIWLQLAAEKPPNAEGSLRLHLELGRLEEPLAALQRLAAESGEMEDLGVAWAGGWALGFLLVF